MSQGRERRKGGRARLYTHDGLEHVVDAGDVVGDRERQLRSTACDAPFGIRVVRSAEKARAIFDRATLDFRIGKRHGTLATDIHTQLGVGFRLDVAVFVSKRRYGDTVRVFRKAIVASGEVHVYRLPRRKLDEFLYTHCRRDEKPVVVKAVRSERVCCE